MKCLKCKKEMNVVQVYEDGVIITCYNHRQPRAHVINSPNILEELQSSCNVDLDEKGNATLSLKGDEVE